MATATTARMTAEAFVEWANRPENAGRRYELEDGEVIEMPSPGRLHGTVCGLLAHVLYSYLFARRAGSLATNDSGLVVGRNPDTVRGPDVMLFLTAAPLDGIPRGLTTDIPDLVVEVLSPSDSRRQHTRRVRQYLTRGVRLVWVVDPDERVVYVHIPGEYVRDLSGADELTGDGVLPDFRCRVADFFTLPGESPPAAG